MKKLIKNCFELSYEELLAVNGGYGGSSGGGGVSSYAYGRSNYSGHGYASVSSTRINVKTYSTKPGNSKCSYSSSSAGVKGGGYNALTGGLEGSYGYNASSAGTQQIQTTDVKSTVTEGVTESNSTTEGLAKVAGGICYPLGVEFSNDYVVTSEFGKREPITLPDGKTTKPFHSGIDIAAKSGTRINAVMDGVVVEAGQRTDFGNYVIIKHPTGSSSIYAHCDSLDVTRGTSVSAGQKIASVGTTGMSTGPHLHFSFDANGNGSYEDYVDNPATLLYGGH